MRPIQSTKHIVDLQGGIIGNATERRTLVTAVDNPVLANTSNVASGSKVSSMYLNVTVLSQANTALNNIYFMIFKNPQGNIPDSEIPPANQVGSSEFKRQVFHQEMRMLSDASNSIPSTMFQGVLKIPRIFHTMRVGDQIGINFFSPGAGNDVDFCVQCIYKSYR